MVVPVTPTPTVSPSRWEGVLERGVGVIIAPLGTLRAVAAERATGQALLVILVAAGIVGGVTFAPIARESEGGVAWVTGGVLLGLLLGLPFVAAWAGLCHVAARLLGQQGPYAGLFATVGFTSVLAVFQPPVALVGASGGSVGAALSGAWSLLLVGWGLVLQVLAVRANYGAGTGMALAVIVLAVIGALVVTVLLIVAAVVLVLLGLLAALR